MPRKGYTPEQIIGKLREVDVLVQQGHAVREAVRRIGVSDHTYYVWRREYGGMGVEQAKRLRELERENVRLKRLVADLSLDKDILTGIPQIKPTFLDIAPSGIPSNIIPHSKGVKCGLIRSNSPFSYSNHRPAKPKIPKPLVYAQVSPLGTSFATP